MLLATRDMIREIDEYAERVQGISPEILMQNAGLAAASQILEMLDRPVKIVVLCGKGKNGGDGYVIASELWEYKCEITVFEHKNVHRDAASSYHRARAKKKIKDIYPLTDTEKLSEACKSAEIIIDALFGVGFHGDMPAPEANAIRIANATSALKIAVDIPSGADSDMGGVAEVCFAADHTMTMAYVKRGMLLYPAREYCGRISVCDIGVDREAIEQRMDFSCSVVGEDEIKKYVLARPKDSHKGTFGRLMLICGSDTMTGAAILACEGALRMGVGLCELVCTERVAAAVSSVCPEVIYTVVPPLCEWNEAVFEKLVLHSVEAQAIVIGCGMGQDENAQKLIRLLSSIAGCPMLVDADGLNSLDGRVKILANSQREIVVTPHPKEFARLVFCDIKEVQKDKYRVCERLSEGCALTVLLKGASTVVCAKDGKRYINTTGNSGLAKGGSGDVLSGIIGALLARGVPSGMAAALGAHIHGAAADALREELTETGMLPRDIPTAAARYLSKVAKNLRVRSTPDN